MKSKVFLFFMCFVTTTAANAMGDIAVYGEAARTLAQSFMNSGLVAEVNGTHRSIQVDNLVIAHDSPQTLCESPDSVRCGFKPAPVVYYAKQKETRVKVREAIQLADTLKAVIDPILHSRHLNIDTEKEGRVYREYGSFRCAWELQALRIEKAECLLKSEAPKN